MGYKDNKIKKTLFINEYFHYCIHLNQLYQLIFVQNLIAHYQEGPIAFFSNSENSEISSSLGSWFSDTKLCELRNSFVVPNIAGLPGASLYPRIFIHSLF